ncbi:MAG: hypothetical protein ACK4L8_00185 [Nitrincola lacisaponensis]|uniref:hypothetical protein n=1 Tax=Nitrincola lacisaponensis TaxID=267850 RepID=UPI0039197E5D
MKTDISAWGDTPPDWIVALAAEVDSSNRTAVAQRLGISRTSVSLVLVNKYPSSSTQGIEKRVMALLSSIQCPVMGEISAEQCQTERKKPFVASNPTRIRLYRACSTCPHNPSSGEGHGCK